MNYRIAAVNTNETILFAAHELGRYLQMMDPSSKTLFMLENFGDTDTICIGTHEYAEYLPKVNDPELDDAIYISVNRGNGIIAGNNPRAALIAVYRFLFECGCRFVRPGEFGEVIPECDISTVSVNICEAASYRHRAVCIEGACSYENVRDMIDYLPKIGMNGYFIQFMVPSCFFERWYRHDLNPEMDKEQLSSDEVLGMVRMLEYEIKKRGLLYHKVGHSWTCEPFGIDGSSWETNDYTVSDEAREAFALIDGQRELWGGIPLNTNLCYSKPWVRNRITDAIVEYCKKNPSVDYLHFWLADGLRNHCECDGCRDTSPSDFYVIMLNELDEKLSKAELPARIVFLIYVDLLWAPEREKLSNPERFVLMFAPITRTYSKAFSDGLSGAEPPLAPYERNKNIMPKSVEENIARLRQWQQLFRGDSFVFDYHLMWDHYSDPGYTMTADILFRDMVNLDKISLNGMVSCQSQRVFLPTGFPFYAMAAALWNKATDYRKLECGYYLSAFGDNSGVVENYLKSLTSRFDPAALRNEKPLAAGVYTDIEKIADDFLPIAEREQSNIINPSVKKSWEYLKLHAIIIKGLARFLDAVSQADTELSQKRLQELIDSIGHIEPEIQLVFDVWNFIGTISRQSCI